MDVLLFWVIIALGWWLVYLYDKRKIKKEEEFIKYRDAARISGKNSPERKIKPWYETEKWTKRVLFGLLPLIFLVVMCTRKSPRRSNYGPVDDDFRESYDNVRSGRRRLW